MASLIDKLLDAVSLSPDDEDDDDFEQEEYEANLKAQTDELERIERTREKDNRPARRRPAAQPAEEEEEEKPAMRIFSGSKKNTAQASNVRSVKGMEVCLIRPVSVEDAREISDTLLSGRAVVINLEGLHVELAQRIIDFTSGACYSISGNLQKISNYIFIVTPKNIELSGDFQEFLSGNGTSGMNISTLDLSL